MNNASMARRIQQRRQKQRRRRRDVLLWRSFLAFQIVAGGISGILIGAIILNTIQPGHPLYVEIRGWLTAIFH